MDRPVPSADSVNEAIRELVERNRARCLWFAPADYQPETTDERVRALGYIERHGDREAFIRARELLNWLLQISKGT